MIEDKDFIKYCMSRLSADERKFIEYRYYDEKKSKGNFRNNGYFSNAGVANGKTHFEKIEKSLF